MSTLLADGLVKQLRESASYRLSAIVEMARLSEADRQSLQTRHARSAWPLLGQPQYANIREVGPWLFSAGADADLQAQYDFHHALTKSGAEGLCGWLISAMPSADLAVHLGHAATARGPDGHLYLLRFHTEFAFPVLYARQDLPGVRQWLAPIRAWWLVQPHPERSAWRHYAGPDLPAGADVPDMVLDQACWDALAGDPFTCGIADRLRDAMIAAGQKPPCHGVQLAKVAGLLAEARARGLTRLQDLSDYVVLVGLSGRLLRGAPDWEQAVAQAGTAGKPLAAALAAALPQMR